MPTPGSGTLERLIYRIVQVAARGLDQSLTQRLYQ